MHVGLCRLCSFHSDGMMEVLVPHSYGKYMCRKLGSRLRIKAPLLLLTRNASDMCDMVKAWSLCVCLPRSGLSSHPSKKGFIGLLIREPYSWWWGDHAPYKPLSNLTMAHDRARLKMRSTSNSPLKWWKSAHDSPLAISWRRILNFWSLIFSTDIVTVSCLAPESPLDPVDSGRSSIDGTSSPNQSQPKGLTFGGALTIQHIIDALQAYQQEHPNSQWPEVRRRVVMEYDGTGREESWRRSGNENHMEKRAWESSCIILCMKII